MKHRAVAICGYIGSGKSAVGNYLVSKGYSVIDCDVLSRQLAEQQNIIAQVRQLLGDKSISGDKLDRSYIRSVIFDNDKLYSQYTAIFAVALQEMVLDIINNSVLVFVQLPIYDAISYHWHSVWNIVCDNDIRVARTVARDNTSAEDVASITARQNAVVSSYTIFNSSTLEHLHSQIDSLLFKL